MKHPRQTALLPLAAALSATLLLAAGCARFDPAAARRDHTADFSRRLATLASNELARPLSLDDCLRLAMIHNYDARQADLKVALNRIGRNVAFTAFLPSVSASGGFKSYSRTPDNAQREYAEGSLAISLPLFMPSAWYLYAAQRQRVALAQTAAFYVRQGIVLQTSVAYYDILIARDTVAALESQLQAARETADRVGALAAEGLVARWEGERAAFLAEARTVELARARRRLAVAKSELLAGLGLPPDAPFEPAPPPPPPSPLSGTPADLVLDALASHPALAMADRQVVIASHQVRQAFTAFLPTLSLFSTRTWTGNDLAGQSANWLSGLSGAWTLFNGLANVAEYKASKVNRTSVELAREHAFLTVMIQVIAAEAALRDAAEAEALYRSAFLVAEAKLRDYQAQAKEGLLPMIDALDAQSERDLAQLALVRSRYQAALARAGLDLALGRTLVPLSDPKPETTR